MTQLRHRKEDLEQLGIRVKVVAFDNEELGKWYVASSGLEWPILLDTERDLYRGYGMQPESWWMHARPSAIWKFIKLIIAGNGSLKMGKDVRQLGGDVLTDPQGVVRMHDISTTPFDRPEVDSILDVVRSGSSAPVPQS